LKKKNNLMEKNPLISQEAIFSCLITRLNPQLCWGE